MHPLLLLLLPRDPTQRPTAKEALKHPWLRGNSAERSMGRQIDLSVVQRIQRFAQNNHFKRSVLQLIAEELLSRPGAIQSAAVSVYAAEGDENMATAEGAAEANPRERSCPLGEDGRPIITHPASSPMQHIFESMRFKGVEVLEREQVAAALEEMGYRLAPCEVQRLVEQVRRGGAMPTVFQGAQQLSGWWRSGRVF
jgi:calcium-dependent protein kinase